MLDWYSNNKSIILLKEIYLFQLEKVSKNLEEATASRNEFLKEIELLNITRQSQKFEMGELQRQLVEKTAKEAVDVVVELATDHIVSINTKETQTEFEETLPKTSTEQPISREVVEDTKWEIVPTFHWPGTQETPHQQSVVNIEQPIVQNQNPFAVNASIQPSLPPLSDLESQILSASDIADAASNRKALQEIEFEKVDPSFGNQSQPIIEQVVQPKQAYLTFQPGAEAFGENDDGWGWGPEESKLEEEHQNRAGSIPQVQNLKMQLAQATEKLQVCCSFFYCSCS